MRLTANVFYASYRDMQLTFDLTPTDPSDFEFVVRIAPNGLAGRFGRRKKPHAPPGQFTAAPLPFPPG